MALTKIELDALKHRVSQAHHLGYSIANPAEYVERLGGGKAPEGIEPFSTAHVLYLIELCEAGEQPVPTPVVEVAPAVEVAPVVEPVAVVEETPVEAAPVVEAATAEVTDEKPKKSKKK